MLRWVGIFCIAAVAAGCVSDQKDSTKKTPEKKVEERKDRAQDSEYMAAFKDEKGVVTTSSGLMYKDLKPGEGTEAKSGDAVTVHYTGTLTNGKKFDSSVDRGEPFPFKLGAGKVIKGWDEGVAGMKEGGKRKLVIPYTLAYGSDGRPPVIPGSAALVFEVELLKVSH